MYRASGAGAYSQIGTTVTFTPPDTTLRIRRTGNGLFFEYRLNGQWASVASAAMVAGSTTTRGGIFTATGTVGSAPSVPGVGIRTAFDYLLLSDPGNIADLFNSLRITEIMYNPSGTGGVEYIELRNIGASAINLNGAYFDQGDPFSNSAGDGPFTFGAIVLQPGQYCVVTNDIAGFTARYGNGALIAGQYSGSLNNDGEHIMLRDADGNAVHDFDYSDLVPWPVAADGGGPSIEALNNTLALYGVGTNWRASSEPAGSPGYTGIGLDSDGDGTPDAVEELFGTDPYNAASLVSVTPGMSAGGAAQITFPTSAGRDFLIDYTDTLTPPDWTYLGTVSGTGAPVTFTDPSTPLPDHRFYKVTPVQ